MKSWLLHCMSDVKLCILKLLSSSYCTNWLLILTRMSIFLLILCYRLPQEKQNTKGNYTDPTWWSVAFHSFFGLLSKRFYQLSQMKTNRSIIPSPISKPIGTFLDWVTTFHFARFVHTQCKHHFNGYLFTLHKYNTKFLPHKSFS